MLESREVERASITIAEQAMYPAFSRPTKSKQEQVKTKSRAKKRKSQNKKAQATAINKTDSQQSKFY